MNFSKLKVNNSFLPEWMKFPLNLGRVLKEYSSTYESTFNLYISIPNPVMFTYLLFQGMFDFDAKENISDSKIIKRFLELETGSIVYYNDNNVWRRCSVIEIKKNFTPNQKYHLHVQLNQKATYYIPVDQWKEKLITTDLKRDRILNARILNNFQNISGVLSSLYSPITIKNLEILNQPTAYLSGNKKEFERYLNKVNFQYKHILFTPKDIIHLNSNSHFSNARWLTLNDNELVIPSERWLISIGSHKSISNLNRKQIHGNIFIENQFENPNLSESLRDIILEKIILEQRSIYTKEFKEILDKKDITFPNGVSLIAWK